MSNPRPVKISSATTTPTQKHESRSAESDDQPLTIAAQLAGLGYWVWDEEYDALVSMSKEYADIFGVSVNDIVEHHADIQSILTQVHPEDRERYALVADRYNYSIEYRILRPDGSIRHAREISHGHFDADGNALYSYGSIQDITEQKVTEQALRSSEMKFRILADNVPAVIYQCKNDERYTTLYVNDAIEELCGYTKQQFIDGDVCTAELVHPDFAPSLKIDDLVSKRRPFRFEYMFRHKDGSWRWVEEHGAGVFENDELIMLEGVMFDITERKRAEAARQKAEVALRESESKFRDFAESSSDWLWEMDADLRFTYFSERAYDLSGALRGELLGAKRDEISADSEQLNSPEKWAKHIATLRARKPFKNFEYTFKSLEGPTFRVRTSGKPFFNDAGEFKGYRGTGTDITESYKLSQQAAHDSLTGLINRREFETRLKRLRNSTQKNNTTHALCYLDLDRFKVINDSCGHAAGDQLLRQLGELMKRLVRQRDTLARIGGDEFAVLMEHCTPDQAGRTANALLSAVDEFRFLWQEKAFRVGLSIGLVSIDSNTSEIADILSVADAACYTAKERGRNRIYVYTETDDGIQQRHNEMHWVSQINHAIDNQQLHLFAQEIVPINDNLQGGRSFEILLRMQDDDGNLTVASAFLPVAERFSLSTRLDRWVVDSALSWFDKNSDCCDTIAMCSINLSGVSLGDEEFSSFVLERLQSCPALANKICFEITETAAIVNLDSAISFIDCMRQHGCRFALDDFGSGLSSFNYLKNLPVDYLKIDGSFVRNIDTDEIDKAMVSSINDVAHVMGKQTIAEFVETDAILESISALGVDYAQGFRFGTPEPLTEFFKHRRE